LGEPTTKEYVGWDNTANLWHLIQPHSVCESSDRASYDLGCSIPCNKVQQKFFTEHVKFWGAGTQETNNISKSVSSATYLQNYTKSATITSTITQNELKTVKFKGKMENDLIFKFVTPSQNFNTIQI
jgi:hypothetical protein